MLSILNFFATVEGLTKGAKFVYSNYTLEIVVQWSEHRLVTSEVAGSSPVSLESLGLSLLYVFASCLCPIARNFTTVIFSKLFCSSQLAQA